MNAERAIFVTPVHVVSHLIGSRSESCHFISIVIHERTSLSRFSSSTSTCPSLSSSFPSTSCTASCTLSSTTGSPWKACATPSRGVTTPTTSTPPSQDPWTGFTQFTLLEEKPPEGKMWSGRRLTRKQQTSRPDHVWPEIWKRMGKNAKLKEKQKWSNDKLQWERMHENCEGSMSSTLRTENLRRPSGMLVRNWKHLWLLLCPANYEEEL